MHPRPLLSYALIALSCTLYAAPADAAPRTFARELDRLEAAGALDVTTHDADLSLYRSVKATAKRLRGTRRAELAGALAAVDGIAARGAMRAWRLAPLRLTLQRNLEWWPAQPLLATGARTGFAGSQLVWQRVAGQGLQLH